ncbi:hypothetical protein HDU96_001293 [Phlyctochytrium bullatum]|nr:hypothetical protein HDU96_001293 [Phlyctochytrium bullatum]
MLDMTVFDQDTGQEVGFATTTGPPAATTTHVKTSPPTHTFTPIDTATHLYMPADPSFIASASGAGSALDSPDGSYAAGGFLAAANAHHPIHQANAAKNMEMGYGHQAYAQRQPQQPQGISRHLVHQLQNTMASSTYDFPPSIARPSTASPLSTPTPAASSPATDVFPASSLPPGLPPSSQFSHAAAASIAASAAAAMLNQARATPHPQPVMLRGTATYPTHPQKLPVTTTAAMFPITTTAAHLTASPTSQPTDDVTPYLFGAGPTTTGAAPRNGSLTEDDLATFIDFDRVAAPVRYHSTPAAAPNPDMFAVMSASHPPLPSQPAVSRHPATPRHQHPVVVPPSAHQPAPNAARYPHPPRPGFGPAGGLPSPPATSVHSGSSGSAAVIDAAPAAPGASYAIKQERSGAAAAFASPASEVSGTLAFGAPAAPTAKRAAPPPLAHPEGVSDGETGMAAAKRPKAGGKRPPAAATTTPGDESSEHGFGSQDEEGSEAEERRANLTPQEKAKLRRIRNTEAARKSRQKKNQKLVELDAQVQALEREKADLHIKVAVLENEKSNLVMRERDLLERVRALEQQLNESHQSIMRLQVAAAAAAATGTPFGGAES